MDETTKTSRYSMPDEQGGRVGEHIHQLLSLAHALVKASTPAPPSTPSESAESRVLVSAPLGVDVKGLSDQECVGWAQDLEYLAHLQQALSVQIAAELSHRTVAGRFEMLGVRGPQEMLTQ